MIVAQVLQEEVRLVVLALLVVQFHVQGYRKFVIFACNWGAGIPVAITVSSANPCRSGVVETIVLIIALGVS